MNMKRKVFALVLLLLIPSTSIASVRITEIMYDVPGSDGGREWIEVVNDGTAVVDITDYRLFEANTNHKLTSVFGGTSLHPQGVAVIADDRTKFLADNPRFVGILFESAFSLSNNTEALILRDGNLKDVDSVTYYSGSGARGDGQSLHREGADRFTSGDSHPGIYPEPPNRPLPETPDPATGGDLPKGKVDAEGATTGNSSPETKADQEDGQEKAVEQNELLKVAEEKTPAPWLPYLLGAFGLSALACAGIIGTRYINRASTNRTQDEADTYEIIDG